jgi:hypothetical protein
MVNFRLFNVALDFFEAGDRLVLAIAEPGQLAGITCGACIGLGVMSYELDNIERKIDLAGFFCSGV